MLFAIPDTLLKGALSSNKLVTMLYVITDMLLKVSLNTNKTVHHAIRYSQHIVESGVQHQSNWSPCCTL